MQYISVLSARKTESRDLIKHGTIIGLATVLMNLLDGPFLYLFVFISSCITGQPFEETYQLLLSSSFTAGAFNVFITLMIFTIPFILSAKLLKYKITDLISFDKTNKRLAFWVICLGLGFCYLGNIIASILASLSAGLFGVAPTQPQMPEDPGMASLLFEIVCGAAVPALIEEFAFRGVVFGALKKFGNWPAIFISSLLFAFMHGNFVQIPFAFCVGIGLGIARSVTGSMWPPILIHFINNGVSTLVSRDIGLLGLLLSLSFIVLGILALLYFSKHRIFGSVFNRVPSCYSPAARIGFLVVSPTVILSLLIFIIQASTQFVAV